MNTKGYFVSILTIPLIIFFCYSCTKKFKEAENVIKTENTLKSVHLLYDSIRVEPSELLSSLERINKAIDSIGYPDSGYELWIVQSDSTKNFRYLVEAHWPNQAIYDTIHNHELYNNAIDSAEKLWSGMKSIIYSRFTIVK